MFKTTLKFAVVVLLLLCLVAAPLFGVAFYASPGIFSENPFFTDRQLGQGTSAYLAFQPGEEELTVSEEDLAKTAEKLVARFKAVGYSDAAAEAVADQQVRVDVAQTSFIDNLMSQIAAKGEWSFVNPSQTTVCDASMVESAEVRASNGAGYYVQIHFTEEGAKTFETNCSSLAASSGSAYFYVDGAFTSIIPFSNVKFSDSFTFGSYNGYGFQDYGTASLYAAIINDGALPAAMVVDHTEPLAPTTPAWAITAIFIAFAAAFVVLSLLLILKGRTVGLFAAGALLGDVSAMLIFMLNGAFQTNLFTVCVLFCLMILAGVLYVFAASPCGKLLKEGKSIASALSGSLKKMNIRALWIHATVFLVTIVLWMFVRGSFLYVILAVMIASLVNLASYFVLFYFPTATLAEAQKQKK